MRAVIDLEASVVEELGERRPPLGAVCNGERHHRLWRKTTMRVIENFAEFGDQWLGSFLTGLLPHARRSPAHFGFDGIEGGDPFKDVGGKCGWPRLVDIEYLAPEMGPAGDFGDATALVELVISGISCSPSAPMAQI